LLCDDAGRIKIADFGSAAVRDATRSGDSKAPAFLSTERYAAVEVLEGKTSGRFPADVMSAALTFSEILTRRQPLSEIARPLAVARAVSDGKRPDLSASRDCPAALVSLLQSMWRADPAARPTAAQVLQQIQRIRQIDGNAAVALTALVLIVLTRLLPCPLICAAAVPAVECLQAACRSVRLHPMVPSMLSQSDVWFKAPWADRSIVTEAPIRIPRLKAGVPVSFTLSAQLRAKGGGESKSVQTAPLTPWNGRALLLYQFGTLPSVRSDFGLVSELLGHHFAVDVDDDLSRCVPTITRDEALRALSGFFKSAADAKLAEWDTFIVCYGGHAFGRSGDWALRAADGKSDAPLALKDILALWPAQSRARLHIVTDCCGSNGWVTAVASMDAKSVTNVGFQASGAGEAADGLFTRVWAHYARKPTDLRQQSALDEVMGFAQRPAVFNGARSLLPTLSAPPPPRPAQQ
jgi:hypothetical protein